MNARIQIITGRLLAAALAACAASCAGVPSAITDRPVLHEVETTGNVRYGSDGLADVTPRHWLDVYRPKGVTNAPVLIFIHGGAWALGDKAFHRNVGRTFAERGIVVVSVNYGLAPWTKHPGQVRDVARAFDWVKKHAAEYGGNPGDVFLSGHSAGGHLAALLALNDRYLVERGYSKDDVSGVIGLNGVYRVGGTGPIFGNVFANDEATLRDASPVMHVGDKQPPVLVIYAERELTGLDALAVDFDETLRRHHSPTRLVKVPDRTHVTTITRVGTKDDMTTREMMQFIRTYSRTPAGLVP
jgi:acetyl esterase/lipase